MSLLYQGLEVEYRSGKGSYTRTQYSRPLRNGNHEVYNPAYLLPRKGEGFLSTDWVWTTLLPIRTPLPENLKVAFTGHRPTKIGGYDHLSPLRKMVRYALHQELVRLHEKYTVQLAITGGALGVDTDAALMANTLGIPFSVYKPFEGQESKWPAESQERYRKMCGVASELKVVSEGGYSTSKMQVRNQAMVDNCDVLVAIWDGNPSGTANCVNYAKSVGKFIIQQSPTLINSLMKG